MTTKLINNVEFSVSAYSFWAPGVETENAWQAWANDEIAIHGDSEPLLTAIPPMLRRRANMPGKMALEVATNCFNKFESKHDIPIIFCSRHGECGRSAILLAELASGNSLSPTIFSLSVHNAMAGLFSIANHNHTNNLALSAGHSTIEHAVIEACGLLADSAPAVLLVAYDTILPQVFTEFQDCQEQPYAWAWLMELPKNKKISLSWIASEKDTVINIGNRSAGLEIMRFFLRKDLMLERYCNDRDWQWQKHV